MKNLSLFSRSVNDVWLRNSRFCSQAGLLLIWFLLSIVSISQAQVYYTLSDGSATTTTDELRRINLDGTSDGLIRNNFIQSAGPLVLDAINNRLLVVDTRVSQSTTSLTNTKIVAVSLASGNASTFFTPPYISGATSMQIAGIALDRVNNYLYYTLTDGSATSTQNK